MTTEDIIERLKDALQSVRQDYVNALADLNAIEKMQVAIHCDGYPERAHRNAKRDIIKARIEQIDWALQTSDESERKS